MQLSKAFLLWILEVKDPELYSSVTETYIGNSEFEGNNNWGDYFYVVLKNGYTSGLLNKMRSSKMYHTEMDPDEGHTMFVYKIIDYYKSRVVIPFMEGKYSQIDRDYVAKNFQARVAGGLSTNWRILHKEDGLRAYWESRIGKDLPEDCEVWNKAKKEHEVYKYVAPIEVRTTHWTDIILQSDRENYTSSELEILMEKYGSVLESR